VCNYLRILPAPRNKDKGFTLLEIFICIFIIIIVLTALFSVLNIGELSQRIGGTELEVQQAVRMALDYIVRDLRQTSRNKIFLEEYANETFTELADNLTFAHARFNLCTGYDTTNATPTWSGEQITYDFDPTEQTIIRTDLVNGQSLQFNSITNLTFTKIDLNSLNVNITGQKVARGTIAATVNLQEEVKLRNE